MTVEVAVFDSEGNKTGARSIDDPAFAEPVNTVLVKQVILAYQANTKLGTASTKTRGEVSYSGSKPWRQKGTGRARAGSRSSPLWRGGGVVFGPKPHKRRLKVPQKMKRAAFRQTLAGKMRSGEILVVEGLAMESPKTKKMYALLDKMGVAGRRVLIATRDETVYKSARNIRGVTVKDPALVNALDLLVHSYVVAGDKDFEVLLGRARDEAGQVSDN